MADSAAAQPPRLPLLPPPPALAGSSGEEKRKRIKVIESKLRSHRASPHLSADELQDLFGELEDLQQNLSATQHGGLVEVGEIHEETGETGIGSNRRLAIKKEIREIEKTVKASKKQRSLDGKRASELADRLDFLKAELAPRKRAILSICLQGNVDCGEDETTTLTPINIALADRVAIAGLSEWEASALCSCLHDLSEAPVTWKLWRHTGLRCAALSGLDITILAQELEALAAAAPHVLCVRAASLAARGGICAVLRDFRGALVVLEDTESLHNEEATACLLHAVSIKERWRRTAGARLERAELLEPLQGKVIGDLKLREAKESLELASLFAEAEVLCKQEFDDDLTEALFVEGMRLGLLISANGRLVFYGFILYKFWGPPLKAMSISRIAVPANYQMQGFGRQLVRWAIEKAKQKPRHECNRATLSATPQAVPFYERLGFTPVQGDEEPAEDEGAQETPGSVKMEYHCGAAQKQSSRR